MHEPSEEIQNIGMNRRALFQKSSLILLLITRGIISNISHSVLVEGYVQACHLRSLDSPINKKVNP
ncbi:hypothetical protein ACOSQ2_030475 [Xanthoceras sorbifolium]